MSIIGPAVASGRTHWVNFIVLGVMTWVSFTPDCMLFSAGILAPTSAEYRAQADFFQRLCFAMSQIGIAMMMRRYLQKMADDQADQDPHTLDNYNHETAPPAYSQIWWALNILCSTRRNGFVCGGVDGFVKSSGSPQTADCRIHHEPGIPSQSGTTGVDFFGFSLIWLVLTISKPRPWMRKGVWELYVTLSFFCEIAFKASIRWYFGFRFNHIN